MPQTILSNATASAPSASPVQGTPAAGDFVIHLSASTTPMALVRPSAPELARFTFFVSRRREEGRERFRLHMGYFATRAEAEPWLAVVRELYPAAWVGETPGKKLAQRAAAKPVPGTALSAAAVRSTIPAAPVPAPAPAPAPAGAVRAAPAVPLAAPQPARPAARAPAEFVSDAPTRLMPRPNIPASPAAVQGSSLTQPLDEMRRALSSLDSPARAAVEKPAERELSDSQVLRILDTRRASDARMAATPSPAMREITLLSPDDTATLRQIRSQVTRNAPVNFAVQLEWSVSPIDLDRVPRLAIFNAYTLYKIEGSRGGRRWFGLRLGFFSDALAAKQVAYYVRSEFTSVAVVPVSGDEREQAEKAGPILLAAPEPGGTAGTADTGEQITLIDDRPWTPISSELSVPTSAAEGANAVSAASAKAPPKKASGAAASAAKRASRPRASDARGLEETLEILGASQLSIDTGKGERLNLSGVQVKRDQRTTTFSRLLDRLTDKLRG